VSRIVRSTDIGGALRSRQRGFLLNPFRFAAAGGGGGGRTLVASDNFDRADSGSLGANWLDQFPGWATIDINTNRAVAADSSQPAMAVWAGAGTFTADQYGQVIVATRVWQSSSYRTGVTVRASTDTDAGRDFYALMLYHDNDIGQPVSTHLVKCVNATETILVSAASGIAWVATDSIELEVTDVGGNAQLRCYRNGTLITELNHTDSTSPLTTGKPGLYLQGNDTVAADDWEGGNFS
jgi:hypothetical protein